jgi:sugar phosphate isomerase/epimerase
VLKLGVITDEISQEIDLAFNRLVEWDIPYAEIRGVEGKNVSDLSMEELNRVKTALDERGLKACGIASPFYKCELSGGAAHDTGRLHLATDRTLDEQIGVLRRCIQAAHLLETEFVRVFAFWRRGETTPEIASRIADLFHEPLRIAKEEGVTLLLENESSCYMSVSDETAAFVEGLANEGLRVVWDPGNAFDAGETDPYPTGYETIKPYTAHIHLKDPKTQPDGSVRFVPMGQGEIDYVGHFKALNRDGYSGVISIETHYIPEGGTPEQGTRESVMGLRELLRQAELTA